ncbi:DNA methyltransferase [Escherichia phage K1ind2]|uniref:Putative C-specific methylase n=2 Tax=Kagunavirus K1ind2 TaxID=1911009 RepID=D2XJU8_9CAUD|nr:DNA methyltransferase [Escherichia phage K1ind2]ADA82428.1 putative C-specific methylase [Escherichia phage K1ind2]ADA82477.1 putative C-specific methylase [Escherichia phage K1ind3]
MNYYNEWDKGAAAWLRELIKQGHIPFGVVDERSITEVKPEDLDGFTQCHFFAGIGGWPLALRLAGVPEDAPLWTGSPPCQPFSAAGKQLGQFDPRHLAPVFLDLISECRPPVLFGEQVAPAIAKSWMCDLQTHLEGEDYAVGFAVLPACSVGAPHKRDRLFFGAHRLAHTGGITDNKRREHAQHRRQDETEQTGMGRCDGGLAYTDSERLQGERRDSDSQGREGQDIRQAGLLDGAGSENNTTNPHHGFWSDTDWLGCRDGKFRPVEPGTFPLANGIPARVGRLRGYGNAIVPQVAAEFIKAFMGAVNE